jgi:triosephosphate isomerase
MIIYAQSFIKTNLYPPHFKTAKFLYGGSVNKENAASFCNSHHIDGLLLGRASTEVKAFKELVSKI